VFRVVVAALAALGMMVGLATPALAGDLPHDRLRLKSVTLIPSTGAVAVTVRARCAGHGTMSWQTSLRQDRQRDRASTDVPCDGKARTSTVPLTPGNGRRFHTGDARFTIGELLCGTQTCIGFQSLAYVRLHPHRSSIPGPRQRVLDR
jgi:hypothetical protein